jgi:hypothetical protein
MFVDYIMIKQTAKTGSAASPRKSTSNVTATARKALMQSASSEDGLSIASLAMATVEGDDGGGESESPASVPVQGGSNGEALAQPLNGWSNTFIAPRQKLRFSLSRNIYCRR